MIEDLKNEKKSDKNDDIEYKEKVIKVYVGLKGWEFWKNIFTDAIKKENKTRTDSNRET